MLCYARVLAHYPYVVLVSVMIVSVTCLIVTLTIDSLPSFDEPMAGFEPRGTEISDRLTTYHNLINDPDLSSSPSEQNAIVQKNNNKLIYLDTINPHINTSTHRVKRRQKRQFFCDVPDGHYIKVVYEECDKEDLFTLRNIQSMCMLEEQYITSNPLYKRHCLKIENSSECCHTWSLGNYIAMLTNKPSCSNITEADVIAVKNLVEACVGFYQNFSLSDSCDERHSKFGDSYKTCDNISRRCQKYNGIYNIMHFIADNSFHRTDKKLTYTISFFPLSFRSTTEKKLKDALNLYLDIESNMEPVGKVKIIAADFGIKNDLFHHYLAKDSLWISVSAVLIFLIVWIFTGSIFITIVTFVMMFFSLELAYFAYVFVFKIKFFPYMNLVTVLLVIAIGADDVFVYSKIWHLAKRQRNNGTLEKLVSDTLKHATLSMFVTSLTTAGALLSNIVSPITSVKCFSIFAGTTVVCNLLLMVTAMPAAVVAEEKWCNFCFINSPKFYKRLRSYYRRFFEMLLPKFVLRLRYVWIVFLTIAGIVSGILVFHYPKLQLPTSFHFQMFHDSHLMEIYDKDVRENFWFEKSVGDRIPLMPLTIVWGVQSQDNGDKFNPHKRGTLQYDYSFNPSMPRSQAWLRQFCYSLRETAFYKKVSPLEQNNCFIEHFILYMKQPCTAKEVICCEKSVFPFDENIFETCIRKYIPLSLKTNIYSRDITPMGLKFRGNRIAALIVNFSSNVTYTYEFNTVQKFYMEMNAWVMEQLKSAPAQMSNCWFVSELEFFSIQKSLADGLPVAFGISILVATLVTFLTSLNFLITVYAMLTISFIMLVTVASIVLLGWELNILESVIITIAVGLSIDYTLHYGVAFRVSSDLDTHNRTFSTLARVGSVIFVAAATTFIGGLVMLLSTTLVYQKFGIFLMLVIAISWIFSTLFFSSLLNVIGPHGAFGQFHWPSLDCCSLSSNTHKDRTVYHMSESTMSTSSSGCHHPSTDISITEHDYLTDRSPSSHQGSKLDRLSDSRRGSKPDRSPSSHRGSKPDRSPDSRRGSKLTQNTSSLTIDNQLQWKLLGVDDIFDKSSISDPVAVVVPDLSSNCRKLCTEV